MEKKSACYIVFFFCTGFWSFLYGVGFIYLASQWTKTTDSSPAVLAAGNNMRAAIAFSFFSVFTWVHYLNQQFLMIFKTAEFNFFFFFFHDDSQAGSSYFAYQRYRQGADSAFATAYETGMGGPGGATTPGSSK